MSGIVDIFKRYPIAILCALVSVIGVGVIFLRGDVLDALQAEEEQLSARIDVIDGNSKNSRSIDEDVEQLEAAVSEIEGRVFDREKRAINTNFFYAFGDGVGVKVTEVNQRGDESKLFAKSGPRELSLHSTITYDITAIGTHASLLSLLHKFYVVDTIARVSTFSISPERDASPEGQPELRLNMQVLVLSEKI